MRRGPPRPVTGANRSPRPSKRGRIGPDLAKLGYRAELGLWLLNWAEGGGLGLTGPRLVGWTGPRWLGWCARAELLDGVAIQPEKEKPTRLAEHGNSEGERRRFGGRAVGEADSSCGFGEGAGGFSAVGELRVSGVKSSCGSQRKVKPGVSRPWANCRSRRKVELGAFRIG
ncbi:hypothetical protein CRG98_005967 [Punica granatum]|uniref:Uncharacterized protein n=1 Tax=Punica granatum TaxID=22663 RepID=A0A2I0KZ82_PUNGR|nr:hypothetical protein CRG98_005967 [Punica granatum]